MTSLRIHRVWRGLAWPLALALVLLLPLGAWATTYHTIIIDGTNDFAADETVPGTSGSTWYFTWDDTKFYFGANAADIGGGSSTKWVHLYLDVDPQATPVSGNGTSTGVLYNTQQPVLPFNADFHVRWKADNSYTNMLDWNSGAGSWTDDNTEANNFGIAAYQNGDYVEFSIPRSSLGDPNALYVAGAMINEQAFSEATFFMIPSTNTDGYDVNYTNYLGFVLDAGIAPNHAGNENCRPALTVTGDADSGPGTLRQAIADACVGGSITFNGDTSIALDSELAIDKHLTIDGGSHAITVSGNDAVRVFNIGASGVVTLSHLSIVSGTVTGNGGGIYNAGTVNVTHCTLASNAATVGGGLYNAGGAVVVEASTLISNTATSHGGGLYTTGGTVTVVASTLAYNQITQSAYCANGSGGGGLHNNGGTLIVQNSTLANNAASTNCGGGLFNAGRATVRASTLSGNSADYGGGIWNESGYLELQQTIVANSSWGHDCHCGMNGTNVTSLDGLFEATGAHACGVSGDYNTIFGVDPLLGPLADNGGSTPTFALLPNSPAIDAVWLSGCLAADQRGFPRNDLRCDIGAFELQHADSDTVVRTDMVSGKQAFFGPTRLRVTVTGGDAGTITVTKHLTTPGGIYNTGEITATWWLTASGETFTATVAFCYTPEEIAGLSETDLRAFRWNGSAWENRGGVVADGCVTVADVTAFSAWTLAIPPAPTAARVVGVMVRDFAPVAALPLAGLLALGGAAALRRRRR